MWGKFIRGGGFVDSDLDSLDVGFGKTIKGLHTLISKDMACLSGFAVLVSFNLKGEKTGYTHMPFESTRLGVLDENGETDKIYYNPYYGTSDYDKKYTVCYDSYNPDDVLSQISRASAEGEKYLGQVFWFGIERPLSRIYPKPFYYTCLNWLTIDSKIQDFHSRNIENNFFLGAIIDKYGDPDAGAGEADEDGNFKQTVGEEFSDIMRGFSGSDEGGSIMVNWFTNPDEKANIHPFPNSSNDTLFETLQKLTTDQIAIGCSTPRILLNIETTGKLGDSKEIVNAVALLNGNTQEFRDTLAEQYSILFKDTVQDGTDFSIRRAHPFDILPEWVTDVMTDSEKRKKASEMFNLELDERPEQNIDNDG